MAKKESAVSVAEDQKLETRGSTALAVPDYISGHEGTEGIERSDITYPRLGLCQALTPQKKKSDANYIVNLEEGNFFNTVTQEIYGASVLVIPILFSKQRIKFRPMSEGGGIDCQSFNGKDGGHLAPRCETDDGTAICEFAKFIDNKAPACDKLHNRPCLIVEPADFEAPRGVFACAPKDGPVIVSLKSTGLKISKQWNSLVKLTPNAPMFARVYELVSVEVRKGEQTWFQPAVKPRGFVPPEVFASLKNMYEGLRGINIMADTTGMETEQVNEGVGDTSF